MRHPIAHHAVAAAAVAVAVLLRWLFDPVMGNTLPLVTLFGLVLLGLAAYAVRRAREPGFRRELRASKPAYKYVVHSAFTILVLVVFPTSGKFRFPGQVSVGFVL